MSKKVASQSIVLEKSNKSLESNVTMMPIEAYAMPSSTYVPDDSHCFVVTSDRQMCWKNHGRCWYSEGDRRIVAKNNAYKEWLLEFCPPTDNDKCGIEFGVNGVCHTYANRELLVGENEANVSEAEKDHVCVAVFGKYGFGLEELKALLTASYKEVSKTVTFPDGTLEKVLSRIDDTITDELTAWYKVAIEYFGIPGVTFLRIDLMKKAREEFLPQIIQGREKIYTEYKQKKETHQTYKAKIGALYMQQIKDYLDYMSSMNYISDTDKANYEKNIDFFLKKLFGVLDQQENSILEIGSMNENLILNLSSNDNLNVQSVKNICGIQYVQSLIK